MQREHCIRAVMEVGEGVFKRRIDTEEFHENDSVEVERLIRRQLEEEDEQRKCQDPAPDPLAPLRGQMGKGGGLR